MLRLKQAIMLALFMLSALNIANAQIKIAVMDFKAGAGVTQGEVDGISAIFGTYFIDPQKFMLVERSQIDRVITEQKFQQSSLTQQQMVQIGQILNLSKIVVGDVNVVGGQYNVDVRVVDVQSGAVDATDGATWAKSSSYRDLMSGLANRLKNKIFSPATNIQSQVPAKVPSSVVTLLGYLQVYPGDLGEFPSMPTNIIASLNEQGKHGYSDWRIPTVEELALMKANNHEVGLKSSNYMTSDGARSGLVRLVTTGKTVAEQDVLRREEEARMAEERQKAEVRRAEEQRRIEIQRQEAERERLKYQMGVGSIVWDEYNFKSTSIAQAGLPAKGGTAKDGRRTFAFGDGNEYTYKIGYRLPTKKDAEELVAAIISGGKSERVIIGNNVVYKYYDNNGRIFAVPFYMFERLNKNGNFSDVRFILQGEVPGEYYAYYALVFPYSDTGCPKPYVTWYKDASAHYGGFYGDDPNWGFIRLVRSKSAEELRQDVEAKAIVEQQKNEEEQRLAEEAKLLAEQQKNEEEQRLAEEAKLLAEQQRLEAEKQTEQANILAKQMRVEEEARQIAEQQRIEGERRILAEQTKLEQEKRLAATRKAEEEEKEKKIRKEMITINGVTWATRNLTGGISRREKGQASFVENPNDYGIFYTYEEAKTFCPDGWRLPTREEIQNLIYAGNKWTTLNGVNGYQFGNGNNVIFFPAAGHAYDRGNAYLAGRDGEYWIEDDSYFRFSSSSLSTVKDTHNYKSVRYVRK